MIRDILDTTAYLGGLAFGIWILSILLFLLSLPLLRKVTQRKRKSIQQHFDEWEEAFNDLE